MQSVAHPVRIPLLAVFAALLSAAPSLAEAQVTVVTGDGMCPPGMTPLSVQQAQAQRPAICQQLGQWFIARLAGGGSMDGPGYQCQIRPSDSRPLGHTLCAPAVGVIGRPQPPYHRPPPPSDRPLRVAAGVFDASHPGWGQDVITLESDGSMWRARARRGQRGRWRVEGQLLVLDWGRRGGGMDRLQRVGRGEFASPSGLRITRRMEMAPQPPMPPQPPPPPPMGITVSPGTYDGVHPHWRDAVILAPNGTYRRGNGDPGRWYVQGDMLVLDWQNWGAERLQQIAPGTYRAPSNGFTLTFRRTGGPQPPPPPPTAVLQVAPGTYDGAHPHWRDVVILAPDGTYRRGNGDPGRWYVQGDVLVLDWQSWGAERLQQIAPNTYRASNGFTLTLRGGMRPRF